MRRGRLRHSDIGNTTWRMTGQTMNEMELSTQGMALEADLLNVTVDLAWGNGAKLNFMPQNIYLSKPLSHQGNISEGAGKAVFKESDMWRTWWVTAGTTCVVAYCALLCHAILGIWSCSWTGKPNAAVTATGHPGLEGWEQLQLSSLWMRIILPHSVTTDTMCYGADRCDSLAAW